MSVIGVNNILASYQYNQRVELTKKKDKVFSEHLQKTMREWKN